MNESQIASVDFSIKAVCWPVRIARWQSYTNLNAYQSMSSYNSVIFSLIIKSLTYLERNEKKEKIINIVAN